MFNMQPQDQTDIGDVLRTAADKVEEYAQQAVDRSRCYLFGTLFHQRGERDGYGRCSRYLISTT